MNRSHTSMEDVADAKASTKAVRHAIEASPQETRQIVTTKGPTGDDTKDSFYNALLLTSLQRAKQQSTEK